MMVLAALMFRLRDDSDEHTSLLGGGWHHTLNNSRGGTIMVSKGVCLDTKVSNPSLFAFGVA